MKHTAQILNVNATQIYYQLRLDLLSKDEYLRKTRRRKPNSIRKRHSVPVKKAKSIFPMETIFSRVMPQLI
jgi:hypothetical protein